MIEIDVDNGAESSEPVFEPTGAVPSGNDRIDEAMSRLPRLDEVDVDSHPEIYDEIHTGLRDALAHAGRDEELPAESP